VNTLIRVSGFFVGSILSFLIGSVFLAFIRPVKLDQMFSLPIIIISIVGAIIGCIFPKKILKMFGGAWPY
jgi:hypothetical protein